MRNFKTMLASAVLAVSVAAVVPLSQVSAATVIERSVFHPSYCLDIYHGIAKSGNKVRMYTCNASNTSEHVAINKLNGYVRIFYRPTLCVADNNGVAVLLSCTDNRTRLIEKPVKGHLGQDVFTTASSKNAMTVPANVSSFPQIVFKPVSGTNTQYWQFKVV